jgi:hypothetical protein
VFTAVADRAEGPYEPIGPLLPRSGPLGDGEDGHAAAVLERDRLTLLFQHRTASAPHWRLGIAQVPLSSLARPRIAAAA